MTSWDERLKNEYTELTERYDKLMNLLNKWDNLDFEPKCSMTLLLAQANVMGAYRCILAERMKIEGVEFE